MDIEISVEELQENFDDYLKKAEEGQIIRVKCEDKTAVLVSYELYEKIKCKCGKK